MSRNRCRIYRSNSTASPASVLLGSQPSHTSARRSLQIRAFHLRWDGPGGCRGVGVGMGVGVGVGVGVGGGGWGVGVGGWDGGGGAWRRGMGGAAWPGVAGLTYLQTHVLFANYLQTICKLFANLFANPFANSTLKRLTIARCQDQENDNVLSLLCSPACRESL